MHDSVETIQDTFVRRSWDQFTPNDRRYKLQQFAQGHTLGRDIPLEVKQRYIRNRKIRRLVLAGLMIVAVAVMA